MVDVRQTTFAARHVQSGFCAILAGFTLLAGVTVAQTPATAFELPQWTVTNLQTHPLVGTIWSGDKTKTTGEALETAIRAADHVAIGEIHPNPDHHLIQAAVVDTLANAGRRPTVVFEMIPQSLDQELQKFVAERPADAKNLGSILKWEDRGWPDWSIYRPIAESALRHDLPMKAGAIDRSRIRSISQKGRAALQAGEIQRYGMDKPLSTQSEAALMTILHEGHCSLMPKAALAPMLTVQRARDGALADAMLSAVAEGSDGTVLIAGAGHTRKDWGAPSIIRHRAPDATLVSIAMVEVSEGENRIEDYDLGRDGAIAYDFVIFTPRDVREDPCIALRKRFGKSKPAAE